MQKAGSHDVAQIDQQLISPVIESMPVMNSCGATYFSCDLYFANFSFLNYSRFFEFASDYLNNLNSYLKLGVFNISENFEFARQRFREY